MYGQERQERYQHNKEVVGMLAGLLEAWTGYTRDLQWAKNLETLTYEQKARLRQLFNLLDRWWILEESNKQAPSPYLGLLTKVSQI